jgi:hypothetical protein
MEVLVRLQETLGVEIQTYLIEMQQNLLIMTFLEAWKYCSLYTSFRLTHVFSFQPHYSHRVDSASNRNEYQESSWGVKSGRRVRLKTSPPLWADWIENVEASTSHTHMGRHGLLQG